jgi:hypothetical protein
MYKIKQYSFDEAKKLNVIIKPSIKKDKKIDVFNKDGNYIVSIGAKNYLDYPSYLEFNKSLAEERRRLYKIRHTKNRKIKGSAGYFASEILW